MRCKHFGLCGSCSLYTQSYPAQLASKMAKISSMLAPFYQGAITPFPSPASGYRARAEYKIYHDKEGAHYAMRHLDKKGFVKLSECPMTIASIQACMWSLLERINAEEVLRHKLFGVEFLSTKSGEVLVTMLYHRPLDRLWEEAAHRLQRDLHISLIGRSRGQKVVLSKEYVTEELQIGSKHYRYRHYEQSFTQPNPFVNEKMITWVMEQASRFGKGDLCELYAGSGNFTIPLATLFKKVIATEISKRSMKAALQNCELNGIENITFLRMSSEEFTGALEGQRSFRRLEGIDLTSFDLRTVLVDPPRAGLDEETRKLVGRFETLLYISCNPETLVRDLKSLSVTHRVVSAALFDQFAYTPHMEAGVVLKS